MLNERTAEHRRQALRAGLGALFAVLLTSALFAAPFIAIQQDWGHTHPDGTPEHHHPLGAVLTLDTVPEAPQAPALSMAVLFLLFFPRFTASRGGRRTFLARAPPPL